MDLYYLFCEALMRVDYEQVAEASEEYALIKATEMTESVKNAIDLLMGTNGCLPVIKGGSNLLLNKTRIYYIESVDKKTFVYTKDECFECKYRLYELEEMLGGYFARCAKASIVNLRKIQSICSDFSGRMEAELLNKEKLIIARSYVKEIKRRLDLT